MALPSLKGLGTGTANDFPWRPNTTTEVLKSLFGVGEKESQLLKGVKATAAGAIKGLTLGYVQPKFGLTPQEISQFKIPSTIAEFATWLVPFGAAEKGVSYALKVALKSPVGAETIARAVTKSPQIARFVKGMAVGGLTFAGVEALRKPEEGETRLKSALTGGALGLVFPLAMAGGMKIIKPVVKALGKEAPKIVSGAEKATQEAISAEKGIIPQEMEIVPINQVIKRFDQTGSAIIAQKPGVRLIMKDEGTFVKVGVDTGKLIDTELAKQLPTKNFATKEEAIDFIRQLTKGKPQLVSAIPKELEPLAQEARKYGSAEEWTKFSRDKEVSKVLIGGQNLLPSGTDVNYLWKKEALRKWGRYGKGQSDVKIIEDFYNQAVKGVSPTLPKAMASKIIKVKIPPDVGGGVVEIPIRLSTPTAKVVSAEDPVQKIIQALKEAKPLRGKQEVIYSAERGKQVAKALAVGTKTTGEAGFYKELGVMKGEFPKVQFESIRGKIGQTDTDKLFEMVKESKVLSFWDTVGAREGLVKMFNGRVPTEGEMALLGRVFPKEMIDVLLSKRSLMAKLLSAGYQLANIPRSVMASFDLSAPLRQGVFFIGRLRQFLPAFVRMFKIFGSEKAFQALQESIARMRTFELMREGKLALTGMDAILTQREEMFMSSWAEKIPLAGRIIRASGRAYTGFLNKLRADVFEDLVTKADKLGIRTPDLVKDVANFVNVGTGRGSLGGLQKAATALNSFFFSPRLMASRLTLLNPVYYVRANPFVRKEALKSLFTFAGAVMTVLSLAKMSGAEVGTDWRSSDFGKIKIGNTRIDIMGGFQQYLRMAGQLITGKYVSSTTGKEITLGEGYKPLTRFDIILRQVEAKEAPIFSFLTDLLRGQDFAGKPIKITNEIAQRFYPMAIGDIIDVYRDDPTILPLSALGIFGVGIQTYTNTKPGIPGAPTPPKGGGIKGLPSLKGL